MQDPSPNEHAPLATLTYRRSGSHVLARLVGEIDISNAGELRARLLGLVDTTTGSLSIDLSGVTFIDSSGLGQLVMLRRGLDDQGVTMDLLVKPTSMVDRILSQFGASELGPTKPVAGRQIIPTQSPSAE